MGEDRDEESFFGWKEERALGWIGDTGGVVGGWRKGGHDSTFLGYGRSSGGYTQCEGKEWAGGVWATGTAKTLVLHSKKGGLVGEPGQPPFLFLVFSQTCPKDEQ